MCQGSSLISQPIYSNILQFYRAKLFFTFLSLFFPCYLMLMCTVINRLSVKIQFFSYSDSLPALSGDLSKVCQCRVKHSAPSCPLSLESSKSRESTRMISHRPTAANVLCLNKCFPSLNKNCVGKCSVLWKWMYSLINQILH